MPPLAACSTFEGFLKRSITSQSAFASRSSLLEGMLDAGVQQDCSPCMLPFVGAAALFEGGKLLRVEMLIDVPICLQHLVLTPAAVLGVE